MSLISARPRRACAREDQHEWTHWGLSPGPSACGADVIPLHHVPLQPIVLVGPTPCARGCGDAHRPSRSAWRRSRCKCPMRDISNSSRWRLDCHGTCGLVAMTSASHAEGRQFDPGQVYRLLPMGRMALRVRLARLRVCVWVWAVRACPRAYVGQRSSAFAFLFRPCVTVALTVAAWWRWSSSSSSRRGTFLGDVNLQILEQTESWHLWSSGYDVSLTR